jgi:hypothetical protein
VRQWMHEQRRYDEHDDVAILVAPNTNAHVDFSANGGERAAARTSEVGFDE